VGYLIFLVVMAIVIAVFVWDYRRKIAKREAVSKQRLAQLLKATTPAAPPVAPPPEPVAAAATSVAPVMPSTIALPARERLLSQSETLIYYLLKTGIPDHEVFPKVALAAVVAVTGEGYDREQQARRLSGHLLDFVVCDKGMRIVAAVQVAAAGTEAALAQRIKADCLKAAGIRLVIINPAAMPRRAELRTLVCSAVAGGA
jgi:uncharacterized protein DUF2726